jgi:hypothetical protein
MQVITVVSLGPVEYKESKVWQVWPTCTIQELRQVRQNSKKTCSEGVEADQSQSASIIEEMSINVSSIVIIDNKKCSVI